MASIWADGSNIKPTEIGYATSDAPTYVVVGHANVAGASHIGTGTLNATVGAVTDIADPASTGGWTNLVSITGGPLVVSFVGANPCDFAINGGEDDTDGLRLQILIDGTVAFDVYELGDQSANAQIEPLYSDLAGLTSQPVYCATSFVIRAAREGTLAEANTFVKHSAIQYYLVVPT